MHKIILFVSAFFLFNACKLTDKGNNINQNMINTPLTEEGVDEEDLPILSMQEEDKTFDFGTISQGEKVKHTYTFTNTGKTPLVIASAKPSCGCTVPTFSKEPIEPGEKGSLDVVFDSEGKSGMVQKSISIVSNTQPNTTLVYLKGIILTPEK